MPKTLFSSYRKLLGAGLLLTPFVLLCVQYLDVTVALYVKDHLYANAHWSRATSDLPDLLLLVVFFSMLGALLVYLIRSRRGIYDAKTRFAKLVLFIAPASYLAKMVLKIAFGRVNTRCWVQDPSLYGFQWFQMKDGFEGFPSGHMLVICALLAALSRFYPSMRALCLFTATGLGLALVLTNYHFVSDVVAGAYLALLLEAVAFRLLIREPSREPSRERAGGS